MEEITYTIEQAHKFFGIELNQLTWTLLNNPSRTVEEDEKMIHSAHGSHFHWLHCGTKVNEQRGEWLISRVYSVLGIPERAMYHALKCKKLTEDYSNDMCDFDIAYSDEAMARAYACNHNDEKCKEYFSSAMEKGNMIANKEDKEIFLGDLNSEPWFGALK